MRKINIADANEYLTQKIKAAPQIRVAFLSAFFVGIIAHIVFITSMIVNHDSVATIAIVEYYYDFPLSLGRWAHFLIPVLVGSVPAQGIIGVLGVLMLSFSSCFIVAALSVKSRVSAAIISCFIVLFPSVCGMFLYLGFGLTLSFMLASAAAYFSIKYKRGFIAGIIILAFSLGLYQAYIGTTAALFLTVLIISAFDSNMSAKTLLFSTIKYFFIIIAAIGLYYLILQIVLAGFGESMRYYSGMNEMGQMSLSDIPVILKTVYKKVWLFFARDAYIAGTAVFAWLYRIFALFFVSLLALLIIKNKVYKKPVNLALLIIFIALFPFAIHMIQFLNHAAGTHALMIFPFVLLFAAVIKLSEFSTDVFKTEGGRGATLTHGYTWAVVLVSVMLIFNWWIFTNQTYKLMQYTYESTVKLASNISNDIRTTPGFTTVTPIILVFEGGFTQGIHNPIMDGFSHIGVTGVISPYAISYNQVDLLKMFMGAHFSEVFNIIYDPAINTKIRATDEYQAMPVYPNYGYIQEIDGFIVVKVYE